MHHRQAEGLEIPQARLDPQSIMTAESDVIIIIIIMVTS